MVRCLWVLCKYYTILFIGRRDADAEAPIFWPQWVESTDAKHVNVEGQSYPLKLVISITAQ